MDVFGDMHFLEQLDYRLLLFFWCLLQGTVAGSLSFLMWRLVRERLAIRTAKTILLVVTFSWILPLFLPYWWTTHRPGSFHLAVFMLSRPLSWGILALGLAWLAGFLVQLVRYGAGLLRLKQLRNKGKRLEDAGALCADLPAKLWKTARRVSFYIVPQVETPMSMGVFHPAIYLPGQEVSPEELRLILCHELTHIKNRDALRRLLGLWVRCLAWFLPCAKALFREIRAYNEYVCDSACCQVLRLTPEAYIQTIRRYEISVTRHMPVEMLGGSSLSLKARKAQLMRERGKKERAWRRLLVCVLLLVFTYTATLPVMNVVAQAYDWLYWKTAKRVEADVEFVMVCGDEEETMDPQAGGTLTFEQREDAWILPEDEAYGILGIYQSTDDSVVLLIKKEVLAGDFGMMNVYSAVTTGKGTYNCPLKKDGAYRIVMKTG